MAIITRNINAASHEYYDLIIIGGGVHGVMLALEASIRNIKTLLVEKSDFGACTSYNSLRILHGGFRYMQNLDLQRLYESANERRWFLKYFPDLASPLPCMMPLHGQGLRHPGFLWPALKAYDLLTLNRNKGLSPVQQVQNGKILSARETLEKSDFIRKQNLKGGALWYDGFVPDSQRIVIGALRWACEYGLNALNYVRATGLVKEKNNAVGITACDEETFAKLEFRGKLIVNATGPWCRDLAQHIDRDEPTLFRSMLAWNVLFNRQAISSYAIAASPPGSSAHTYFVVPWKGMMFAGTGHAPWDKKDKDPRPTDAQLEHYCHELNRALPGINLDKSDIVHVFAGLQSAKVEGGTEFTKREVIIDHSENGGPNGFFSISGIKFTTSRKVAEKVINKLYPDVSNVHCHPHRSCPPPKDATTPIGVYPFDWEPDKDDNTWIEPLIKVAMDESVIHLNDLVVRRTSLGDNPARAMALSKDLCKSMGWNDDQIQKEIKRIKQHFCWANTLKKN
jgi:glycerol-3-phosphate dehydrogenase